MNRILFVFLSLVCAITARGQYGPGPTSQTLAELLALSPRPGTIFQFSGRNTANDGGGGILYWDPTSTATTNLGTCFASHVARGTPSAVNTTTGRWLRRIDDGVINAAWFGAIGDGDVSKTNRNLLAIQNAWDSRGQRPVYLPAGRYPINGTLNIASDSNDRTMIFRGAGAGDNDGTEILQYGGNQTIVALSGAGPEISGLTLRWPGNMRPLSTDTNAVALRINTLVNGVVRDLNLVNCGVAIRSTPGTDSYSTLFENISIYGYSQYGIDLSARGTQQTFVKVDVRNVPEFLDGYLNTGTASNSGTNLTITGQSAFCTNLVAGQLVILSGMSPFEFNGIFTVYSPTSTNFLVKLASAPSGSVSGTPTMINYYGRSTGRAIYIAPGNRAHFFGLNVEYNQSRIQIECLGWAGFYGCSFEGFMGVVDSAPFIYMAQGGDFSSVQFFNITAPSGSAYHVFGTSSGAVINLGSFSSRDLYYAGASLGWITSGGKLYGTHHFRESTARWDRTSELSSQMPNSRLWRPSGYSVDNIEFALDGLNDRRLILAATYLDSRDNVTGLTEKAFTLLPGHYGAGGLFFYSVGTTNTAYQFAPGTSDQRLYFSGNSIQALDNLTGATPGNLTLGPSGGTITLRRKTYIGAFGGPTIESGTGSPEGVITAEKGSLYLRTDGGAGTSHYVKESGSGNTGWVAK